MARERIDQPVKSIGAHFFGLQTSGGDSRRAQNQDRGLKPMKESTKAIRTTVTIGNLAIEGFMLPDGSYRMSQTQAAESVGLKVQNVSDFLRSKALKSFMGEGYTPQISEIEPDELHGRGASRINAVPIDIVTKYWLWQVLRGNKKALALVDALTTETIERRFDAAFGVTRTDQERDERLTNRIQQLEQDLTSLGDAFEFDSVQSIELRAYREESQRLRSLLAENGIDEV